MLGGFNEAMKLVNTISSFPTYWDVIVPASRVLPGTVIRFHRVEKAQTSTFAPDADSHTGQQRMPLVASYGHVRLGNLIDVNHQHFRFFGGAIR